MHLVQTMAYVGDTPWHGLGNPLASHQPLEVWAERAGMNWRIEESAVRFVSGNAGLGAIHAFPAQKVLYRSDTKAPLSVVSSRYKVVQPSEILEFYRDLTEVGGFELETAGVLKEGRKLWALARTGQSATLKGRDRVNGYLLLATACDGTLATTAQFTSVRWSATTPSPSPWETEPVQSKYPTAGSSTPRRSNVSSALLSPPGTVSWPA